MAAELGHRSGDPLSHRLAAVWFADIVGYSRLTSESEEAALALVRVFQECAREAARRYGGRIVKYIGDAALGEFPSTEAAVRAAGSLALSFRERAIEAGLSPAELHTGVHLGEVATAADGDLYGEGLNVAARLQTEAAPGQILASEDVWRQLHHRSEFRFEPLGPRALKGSAEPVDVYAVRVEGPEPAGRWEAASWRSRVADLPGRQRLAWLGIGILVAVVVLGVSTRYILRGDASVEGGAAIEADRLAVLYFEDFTAGGGLGYLADGLTEGLIHELSQVPDLEVVSRNGVKPFQDQPVPVDSVARVLRAGTLVQGSVTASGNRLRVRVQLIDGETGTVLESETLERPRGELFALQDDLARQVADFLRRRLGEEIRIAEMRAGTDSVVAWELVQRAERLRRDAEPLVRAGALEEAGRVYDRADSLLSEARAVDSTWAQPALLRGWLAYERAVWRETSDPEGSLPWIETGLEHARRALRMRPGEADALELRGTLRLWQALFAPARDPARAETQLAAAEQDLRAAVDANSGQAGAWYRLTVPLAARGELREAKLAAQRAYEADAYLSEADDIVWRLFTLSYDLNESAEAERWCLEGAQRFPDNLLFVQCRLWLLTMPGIRPDPRQAWSILEEYERAAPPHDVLREKWNQTAAAAVLARAGLRDSAIAVAVRARADERVDPARALMNVEAFVRALAGRETQAVGLLAAYLDASPGQRGEVAQTWWFESLHDRADFQTLVGAGDSLGVP